MSIEGRGEYNDEYLVILSEYLDIVNKRADNGKLTTQEAYQLIDKLTQWAMVHDLQKETDSDG